MGGVGREDEYGEGYAVREGWARNGGRLRQEYRSMASASAASASASATSDLQLLIGVMSYTSPVALGRRQAMRSLIRPVARTSLRFVMARSTPDADANEPDVLPFDVKESSRNIGTYLLNNAFFRYAVALNPRVPFIGRADDDSFFNLSTVLTELLAVSLCSSIKDASLSAEALQARCAKEHHIIYGDFKEWYMWSPRSMMAGCFDFSHDRHAIAMQRLDEVRGDASQLPRFQRECLHADNVGPYPFAKGPLVVFSRSTAAAIVATPEFDADEQWAVADRKSAKLRNLMSGALYEPKRVLHPSRQPLFDDIYFGYLTLVALSDRDVLLVNARISEFDKKRPYRLDTQMGFARIYHKLKTAHRFGWIANYSQLPRALAMNVRTRFDCTRRWKRLDQWRVRNLGLTRNALARMPAAATSRYDGGVILRSSANASMSSCCLNWRFCFGSGREGAAFRAPGSVWKVHPTKTLQG